jgi:hypothetical protein
MQQISNTIVISLKLSTAYHSETDGQTERANQNPAEYLRKYVNYAQDDWVDWLSVAKFQANNTKNATTGMTLRASTTRTPGEKHTGTNPKGN